MTTDERATLRALEKAATPGPWRLLDDYGLEVRDDDGERVPNDGALGIANWTLVVAVRNALPHLLDAADECERLREVVEAAKECHWSPPDGSDVECRLCAALARLEKGAGE